MASSSSADTNRREQSLARMAILSDFGGNGSGPRADSPFTILDRALDEIEKMGRPPSAESVAAVVTQRPKERQRRSAVALSSPHTPASSPYEAIRTQRHRQGTEDALRGVPSVYQAYRPSRASWPAPNVLEDPRDVARVDRGAFEPMPTAADAFGGHRRHRRPSSVSSSPAQEPASSCEVLGGGPRRSMRHTSGVAEVGTRPPVSVRPTLQDPRAFEAERRQSLAQEQCESMGPVAPGSATTALPRTFAAPAAAPEAGASFTQRVASGQTGSCRYRVISAYNPLVAVKISPLFSDKPVMSLYCRLSPSASDLRGHCREARLRAQASGLRRASLDIGFAADPVTVDRHDPLHLPKPRATAAAAAGPPPDRRSFFAHWMPMLHGQDAEAEVVAEPKRPLPLTGGSTLSFDAGEDHLDVCRSVQAPAPVGRTGDDRYRLPSQAVTHRAPAKVSRRQPLPPKRGRHPDQRGTTARGADPAARRTLRRAGVNVTHVRNNSA